MFDIALNRWIECYRSGYFGFYAHLNANSFHTQYMRSAYTHMHTLTDVCGYTVQCETRNSLCGFRFRFRVTIVIYLFDFRRIHHSACTLSLTLPLPDCLLQHFYFLLHFVRFIHIPIKINNFTFRSIDSSTIKFYDFSMLLISRCRCRSMDQFRNLRCARFVRMFCCHQLHDRLLVNYCDWESALMASMRLKT